MRKHSAKTDGQLEMCFFRSKAHAIVGFICIAFTSCTALPGNSGDCKRRFSDDSIRKRVISELKLVGDYEINVNWSKCKYFLLIFPPSRAPDSEIIVTFDENGRIVDGPR